MHTYTVELAVPSGRIVFADDLRSVIPEADDSGLYYNTPEGRAVFAQRTIETGVAYGAVGNTSPNLFRDALTGALHVANPVYDIADEPVIPDSWVELGDISTDLWAYSIADADTYVKHGGDLNNPHVTVAEVPAGFYTFTHFSDDPDFDRYASGLVIHATATYRP